ncbi:hypothetical protein B0H14DRAFT_2620323 [Mycena olivaceomarginata]|nr:hypothetical protein B0H14DRAFT_2620323 [Mycena olivaceomarginata]
MPLIWALIGAQLTPGSWVRYFSPPNVASGGRSTRSLINPPSLLSRSGGDVARRSLPALPISTIKIAAPPAQLVRSARKNTRKIAKKWGWGCSKDVYTVVPEIPHTQRCSMTHGMRRVHESEIWLAIAQIESCFREHRARIPQKESRGYEQGRDSPCVLVQPLTSGHESQQSNTKFLRARSTATFAGPNSMPKRINGDSMPKRINGDSIHERKKGGNSVPERINSSSMPLRKIERELKARKKVGS